MPRLTLPLLTVLLLAGCRSAETVSPGAVAVASSDVVPAGTEIGLRLEQPLGLASDVGDPFRATVASLVVTEGGALVIPAGTAIVGTVTGRAAPRGGRPGALRLAFDTIHLGGEDYAFTATVLRTDAGGEGEDDTRGEPLHPDMLDPAPGSIVSLGADPAEAQLPRGTMILITTDRPLVLR